MITHPPPFGFMPLGERLAKGLRIFLPRFRSLLRPPPPSFSSSLSSSFSRHLFWPIHPFTVIGPSSNSFLFATISAYLPSPSPPLLYLIFRSTKPTQISPPPPPLASCPPCTLLKMHHPFSVSLLCSLVSAIQISSNLAFPAAKVREAKDPSLMRAKMLNPLLMLIQFTIVLQQLPNISTLLLKGNENNANGVYGNGGRVLTHSLRECHSLQQIPSSSDSAKANGRIGTVAHPV